jgi:hypothetical protein
VLVGAPGAPGGTTRGIPGVRGGRIAVQRLLSMNTVS